MTMQGPLTQITSAAKRRGVPLEEYLEMLEERFEDTYPHSHVYTLHFHSKAAQKLVMGWFHETLEEEELPVYAYSFENGAQGGALHLRLGIPLHGSVAAQDLDEAFEEWCEENEDSFPEDEDGEVVCPTQDKLWTVEDVQSKNLDKEYTAHQWRKLVSAHRAKGL